MARKFSALLPLLLTAAFSVASSADAAPARVTLHGHVPAIIARLSPVGRPPATNVLSLAIGLPLRNEAGLDEFLRQLQDPRSTNYHKYLTPPEFTARFGPTEQQYHSVMRFAQRNGLRVVGTHSNRLVLDVSGSVADVEHAFQVTLRTYRHPTEPRYFYAPDAEPSVPTNLPVADVWGLSDFYRPVPLSHEINPSKATPLNYNGSGPGGSYQGRDFRNAYAPGTALIGSGQIAAVAEFDGYYANDIAAYEANCGYTNVPLANVLINTSGTPSGNASQVGEVSLDIEMIISLAPGLSRLMVYEGNNPYDVLNRIATDNLARQISCSWSWSRGPNAGWTGGKPGTTTLDSQLKQMAAQGQSFFQASGDFDAYTGGQSINSSTGPEPVDSIYVTSVGGTTLAMSGGTWGAETVWNWGGNTGSGGGVSSNYTIPSWQTNLSMSLNGGSTLYRNIPDVAMTADAVYVVYNNGSTGIFGGTSCAAPLWAGFTALVNQQSVAAGGTAVGFLNPSLYAIAGGTNYNSCFHDITTGNNIGTNTPGLYNAVGNYDLATGLGTPNGTNLINALAPFSSPYFIAQPSSQTVTSGSGATFSTAAGGQAPLGYQWLFNGTSLPPGAGIIGTSSNILTITAASPDNSGNYQLVVTNNYGSVTSIVATLTVNLISPAIALVSSGNPSGFNDNVDFAVTISPTNATGTVQFFTNGVAFDLETLVSGRAVSANLTSLPRGTDQVAAVYSGDANYSAVTNTLVQVVTNHPPTAAAAFYSRPAGGTLYIAVTNLAASWSDADGDTVSLAAVGASTNGVTITNDAGTLVYFNPNNVSDQFVCTITDGWGGANFQSVNISVALSDIAGVSANADGSVTLALTGASGSTYILEATTNLLAGGWLPVATNTLDTNGVWQFNDSQATNFEQRFYRLKVAP